MVTAGKPKIVEPSAIVPESDRAHAAPSWSRFFRQKCCCNPTGGTTAQGSASLLTIDLPATRRAVAASSHEGTFYRAAAGKTQFTPLMA